MVFQYLGDEEYQQFKALQPKYIEARKGSKRVWWLRARLFVDGVEVLGVGKENGKGGASASSNSPAKRA